MAAPRKGELEAGIACPPNADCDPYLTGGVDVDPVFNLTFPEPDNPLKQLRVEPLASSFVFAEMQVGVDLFVARFALETLRVQGGPVRSGSFATPEGQFFDPVYQSKYKDTFDLTLSLGKDIKELLKLLKVQTGLLAVTLSGDLWNSPTLRSASTDVASYEADDTVTFDVKLNPEDISYFPLIYNVDEVLIFQTERVSGTLLADQIASATPASDGQTDFTLEWTPTTSGSIGDNFYVAVKTNLVPDLPLALGTLEVGTVTPREDETEAFCTGEVDEDEDGLTDCDDPDCANDPACAGGGGGGGTSGGQGTPEVCYNHDDDDLDGYTDCADPDCDSDSYCVGPNSAAVTGCSCPECGAGKRCASRCSAFCKDGPFYTNNWVGHEPGPYLCMASNVCNPYPKHCTATCEWIR